MRSLPVASVSYGYFENHRICVRVALTHKNDEDDMSDTPVKLRRAPSRAKLTVFYVQPLVTRYRIEVIDTLSRLGYGPIRPITLTGRCKK